MNKNENENEKQTKQETAPAQESTPEQAPIDYPARLIDRACNIADFASKESNRYILQTIHFTPVGVEATNGATLIRVPYPSNDIADFPPIAMPSTLESRDPKRPESLAIVPAKAVKEALQNLPKSNVPILARLKVSSDKEKIHFGSTDLDLDKVNSARPVEGDYPNCDAVIPTNPPTLKITLSAVQLQLIVAYALKHAKVEHAPITFGFLDEMENTTFSIEIEPGRVATGVLAPMRMS